MEDTWKPLVDSPKLKDPQMSATDLSRFLAYCQQGPGKPHVHQNLISYPTGTMKSNWQDAFADATVRDTYERFWKEGPST